MKDPSSKLTAIIICILFNCFSCKDSFKTACPIDVVAWNDNTVDFIELKCLVDLNIIHMGGDTIKSIRGGKEYSNLRQYLNFLLLNREDIICKFFYSKRISFKNLKIWENYSGNTLLYQIIIDEKDVFNVKLAREHVNEIEIEEVTPEKALNLPYNLDKGEQKCYAEFIDLPNEVWIFSRITANNSIETYKVTLSK
jgi:hypothetical protein